MKKKICFILMVVILFSSCVVSYRGTLYGRVNRQCPTLNPTAFFYERGTGKSFLPRNVFRKKKKMVMDKKEQEKLLTEIMDADAKDGLYDHIGDTNKMVNMKLYTEEQVRQAIRMTRNEYPMRYVDDIINDLTPIELPSDEEIYEQSYCPPTEYYNGYHDEVFIAGAKWMLDKILNK